MTSERLTAITVCIDYADYLEAISDNRNHFDRWIIVTSASDYATIAVCQRHDLEFITPTCASDTESPFDAAYNKGATINAALSLVPDGEWVLLLDSDVFLPNKFRSRLALRTLFKSAIYGLSGRRTVLSLREFQAIKGRYPWKMLERGERYVMGYCQLFHKGTKASAYPIRSTIPGAKPSGMYDDLVFQHYFTIGNHRTVGLQCIHVGASATNWHGRITPQFALTPTPIGARKEQNRFNVCEKSAHVLNSCSKVLYVYTEHHSMALLRTILNTGAELYLIEPEQRIWSTMLLPEAPPGKLRWLGANCDATWQEARSITFSDVFLDIELSVELFSRLLPHILPVVGPGSRLWSFGYDPQHHLESTLIANIFFDGEVVQLEDEWWCAAFAAVHLDLGAAPVHLPEKTSAPDLTYLLLHSTGSDLDRTISFVASAVAFDLGRRLIVYSIGRDEPLLQLVCVKTGADYRHVAARKRSKREVLEHLETIPAPCLEGQCIVVLDPEPALLLMSIVQEARNKCIGLICRRTNQTPRLVHNSADWDDSLYLDCTGTTNEPPVALLVDTLHTLQAACRELSQAVYFEDDATFKTRGFLQIVRDHRTPGEGEPIIAFCKKPTRERLRILRVQLEETASTAIFWVVRTPEELVVRENMQGNGTFSPMPEQLVLITNQEVLQSDTAWEVHNDVSADGSTSLALLDLLKATTAEATGIIVGAVLPGCGAHLVHKQALSARGACVGIATAGSSRDVDSKQFRGLVVGATAALANVLGSQQLPRARKVL